MRNSIAATSLLLLASLSLSACNNSGTDATATLATDGTSTPVQANAENGNPEAVAAPSATDAALGKALPTVTVYKSPTCGCCTGWVEYLQEEGFTVTAIDHDNVDSIKAQHGLHSAELKSCHTALVDGYVVEGHVPANDILRLLEEKPSDIIGLTAPGMPMMSPGMASREPKDYSVLSFTASGEAAVYSKY